MINEGDLVRFYTSSLDLPLFKTLLGYEYLFMEIFSISTNQLIYIGFIPNSKNFFNRKSNGFIRFLNSQVLETATLLHYFNNINIPIEYVINREQADIINLAIENRNLEMIDSDVGWLMSIFPVLDNDWKGNFYEQLLELNV